jgi:hypothetical protein
MLGKRYRTLGVVDGQIRIFERGRLGQQEVFGGHIENQG